MSWVYLPEGVIELGEEMLTVQNAIYPQKKRTTVLHQKLCQRQKRPKFKCVHGRQEKCLERWAKDRYRRVYTSLRLGNTRLQTRTSYNRTGRYRRNSTPHQWRYNRQSTRKPGTHNIYRTLKIARHAKRNAKTWKGWSFHCLGNYRYFQESAVDYSEQSCWDGTPSAMSNWKSIALTFFVPGLKKAISMTRRYGTMSQHSMVNRGVALWMSLLPDSPASHFQLQGSDEGQETSAICGQTPFALYKKSDPNISFSKTSELCSEQNRIHAYVAGLIDGEGCIGIQENNQKHYSLEITIGMSEKAKSLLCLIQKDFGGSILKGRTATKKWAGSMRWRIGGVAAHAFLKKIAPYLLLKQAQAQIAAELEGLYNSLALHKNGTRKWTAEATKQAEGLKQRMHKLNQKGPDAPFVGVGWYKPMPTLFGTWERFSETWPKAGMIVGGTAYELPTLVRRTGGKGSGLWPSPRTRGLLGGSGSREMIQSMVKDGELSQEEAEIILQVRLYPTPSSQEPGWKHIEVVDKYGEPPEHPNQRFYDKNTGRLVQKGLEQVARMWPTPTTHEVEHPDMDLTETGRRKTKDGTNSHSVGLADQVRMWPTPRANKVDGYSSPNFRPTLRQVVDAHIDNGHAVEPTKMNGSLDPEFVEYLMGFPIGWTDLKDSEMHRFPLWCKQHGGC